MNRAIAVLVGAMIGAVVAVAVFTAYISITSPNNERDSGMPNFAVAIILAGPVGVVLGGVIGALVPLRKR